MKYQWAIMASTLVTALSSQAKVYDCIEVNLFEVDREDISTREMARAAEIPEQTLKAIHTYVRTELNVVENGLVAKKGGEDACESTASALELKGTVTDFKPGSRVMRYMVGFGAGKQKIQIEAELYDKETSQLIKNGRVVDRKVGGWVGGSENKGKRDFAEKINKFVMKALKEKKKAKHSKG